MDARTNEVAIADGLPTPRRYWAAAAIMMTVTLAVLDGTIANVALPTIAADFRADPAVSVWIVNGYQLAVVVSILPFASIGEIYGYRRVYVAGIAVFTLASIACALAGSLGVLMLARVVQGFGAAGLFSVNTALLRYTWPSRSLGMAIGINALVVGMSSTIGPTLAGFILTWGSWPWLFAINVPLGAIAFLIGILNLPESERARRRFDWQSALLAAATIGLAIGMIDSIGHGLPPLLIALQAVAIAVLGTMLVRRELGMKDPMLPLDLLKLPVFSLSIATSVTSFCAQMLAFVALPFLLQNTFGFAPREVGLLMMPWPLAQAIVAPASGRLSDRVSPAILGGVGLVLLAAGMLALGLLPDDPSFGDVAWRMALGGAGFGMFQTPNNRTIVGAAPRRRSGAAGGMLGTARLTGQTAGAALVALIMAWSGIAGANLALFVAAGFAALAALVSLARLGAFRKAEEAARRGEDVGDIS